MTNDFRALCAELADSLHNAIRVVYREDGTQHISTAVPVLDRARAALAKEAVGPSEDRVATLERELERERLRLAACGVVAMADTPKSAAEARKIHLEYHSGSLDDVIRQIDALMEARAVLARYGSAPRPVPVSERLPTAEDCDSEGRCWWGWTTYEGGTYNWHWQIDFHDVDYVGGYCCWLPAHALPIPQENADA